MRSTRYRVLCTIAAALLAATGLTAHGDDEGGSSTPDDGSDLTMWVRAATDQFSQRLVDGYVPVAVRCS